MRAMTTSITRTCVNCGTLNRVVILTTGLTPSWRIGCSRCRATLVQPRPLRPVGQEAAPSATVVRLPVPAARPAAEPPGMSGEPAGTSAAPVVHLPALRRPRLPARPWAARIRTGASTGVSLLAACGMVLAVLIANPPKGGPADRPADGPADPAAGPPPEGLWRQQVAADAPAIPAEATRRDDAARVPGVLADAGRMALPEDAGAPAPAAPLPFFRLAAEVARGEQPVAYPDPMEGMMALQLADPAAAARHEERLALSPAERREVQRRLRLAAHDPKGVDGIFGPGTRAAIAEWQDSAGLPATGYVTRQSLAILAEQTEAEYRAWAAADAARRERESRLASAMPTARPASARADGCVRTWSGRIAYGENVRCDFRGLRERLGRIPASLAGLFDGGGRSDDRWQAVASRPPGDA